MNFDVVCSVKIVDHVSAGFLISMVEDVLFGVHVPLDLVHLVSSMGSILSHNNSTLKFSIHEVLVISLLPVLDQRQAIVY